MEPILDDHANQARSYTEGGKTYTIMPSKKEYVFEMKSIKLNEPISETKFDTTKAPNSRLMDTSK